jgi:hypothetical protein
MRVFLLADHAKAPPRRLLQLLLAGAAALVMAVPAAAQDATFRVRYDIDAPLNADAGWAGEEGEAATVEADRPFRLRFELPSSRSNSDAYALQVRRNGGEWETLEAHDFPYPKRELAPTFKDAVVGLAPPGWTIKAGDPNSLTVADAAPSRVLRAEGGEGGALALYPAPWPLPEFSLAARFRLPAGAGTGFALVFAHADAANHTQLRLDPAGMLTVVRITDGRETVLAQHAAQIVPGDWQGVELQLEDGELVVDFGDEPLQLTVPFTDVPAGEIGIAVPAGGAVELSELVLEGVPRTPPVSIVSTRAYANGEATTDLLSGSAEPFIPAFGLSLVERTPPWASTGGHGEFEWPLVIRRLADGPQVSEPGDRFEFRMVDRAGQALPRDPIALVNLAVPAGHLGGTYVENPGRIGPWQATNGDLYFIMEPTETDNKFMVMKSIDGGRSWHEADGAHRPQTGDLESVDSRLVGDRLHIVHQVTESVRYHVFRTSDHPTHPDTWELRDEVAAQAEAVAQTATMAIRSDKSLVAIFLADRLHYVVRGTDRVWSAPTAVDSEAGLINAGPQAIADRGDNVHFAYFSDDGRIWHRRLQRDGTLTQRQLIAEGAGTSRAEYGAVLPLAYDETSDIVTIAYRLEDGTLWERRVRAGDALTPPVRITGQRVITDAVDSQQPAADLVRSADGAHVLFVDEDTRGIFSTHEENRQWQPPTLRVENIEGSWVRGNIIEKPDGTQVYGYVYDAGSQGGTGLNRYAEFPLSPE